MQKLPYLERLDAFIAAVGGRLIPVGLRILCNDGSILSQEWKEARGQACNACGFKRLTVLYPVAILAGQVYWIGKDCHHNLQERGMLKRLAFEERAAFQVQNGLRPDYSGSLVLYLEEKV